MKNGVSMRIHFHGFRFTLLLAVMLGLQSFSLLAQEKPLVEKVTMLSPHDKSLIVSADNESPIYLKVTTSDADGRNNIDRVDIVFYEDSEQCTEASMQVVWARSKAELEDQGFTFISPCHSVVPGDTEDGGFWGLDAIAQKAFAPILADDPFVSSLSCSIDKSGKTRTVSLGLKVLSSWVRPGRESNFALAVLARDEQGNFSDWLTPGPPDFFGIQVVANQAPQVLDMQLNGLRNIDNSVTLLADSQTLSSVEVVASDPDGANDLTQVGAVLKVDGLDPTRRGFGQLPDDSFLLWAPNDFMLAIGNPGAMAIGPCIDSVNGRQDGVFGVNSGAAEFVKLFSCSTTHAGNERRVSFQFSPTARWFARGPFENNGMFALVRDKLNGFQLGIADGRSPDSRHLSAAIKHKVRGLP